MKTAEEWATDPAWPMDTRLMPSLRYEMICRIQADAFEEGRRQGMLIRCPKCGKIITPRFPIHDCKKPKKKGQK